MSRKISIDDLLNIMEKLRDPQKGCAWELEQTFESIIPYTIEEAYELQDAIENGTWQDILEELGDSLLQIIFYCQIAKEKGWFDFDKVVTQLHDKLNRRNPQIFSPQECTSSQQQNIWQKLKAKERQEKYKEHNTVLSAIPRNLPGLSRAQKLQERAAAVGFDWPHIHFVLDKIQEEIKEFEHSLVECEQEEVKEELGDILFACANLARHIKSDAESIMRQANAKFERRFNAIEAKVRQSNKPWENFSLEELDAFWDEVKATESEI